MERWSSRRTRVHRIGPSRRHERHVRGPRRVLFYARPEQQAARNTFEVEVMAVRRVVADGSLDGIVGELREAVGGARDVRGGVRGSEVARSHWRMSFGQTLLDRLAGRLVAE